MARFRRGVQKAKVFPIGGGYVPVSQGPPPTVAIAEFAQQTEHVKK
jgi:hypothetical protein